VTAYREPPPIEGVSLRSRSSTFWIRLRANLRAIRRRLPWLALVAVTPAVVVLLASLDARFEDSDISLASWIWGTLAVGVVVVGTPVALGVLVRSIPRPPGERDLPREMTFTEETIVVCDANGAVFDAGWSWLAAASATSAEIVLTLRREPERLFFVKREQIGSAQFDKLHGLLEKNGKLE
jgi:hypothetical protein